MVLYNARLADRYGSTTAPPGYLYASVRLALVNTDYQREVQFAPAETEHFAGLDETLRIPPSSHIIPEYSRPVVVQSSWRLTPADIAAFRVFEQNSNPIVRKNPS